MTNDTASGGCLLSKRLTLWTPWPGLERSRCWLLSCLLASAVSSFAQTCTCLPSTAISWWKAEGNPDDTVSNNDGSPQNGVTFASGQVGQAFRLDGVNDYIAVADTPSLRPVNLTIEGWFRFAATDSIRLLVAKPVGQSILNSYSLTVENGVLKALVGDTSQFSSPLNAPVQTGQWYHVAFTFNDNANLVALYLNGVLVDSDSTTVSIAYDGHPLLVGADDEGISGGITWFYAGEIDELTLYSSALTEVQIQAIHNAGLLGKDSALPLISSLPGPIAMECPGSPVFITPTVSDACGEGPSLAFEDIISLGPCQQGYSVTRNWTATDACGNKATSSQTITIVDSTAPLFSCPTNLTVGTDPGQCYATLNLGTPSATDNCDPQPTISGSRSDNQPLHAVYPLGLTTIIWTVLDCTGNSVSCTQVVTVGDLAPPTLVCPADLVVGTDPGQCSATVQYPPPQPIEVCSGVGSVACNPPSGASFPLGPTVVHCSVSDVSGNLTGCQFTITVVDAEMPQIVCPPNVTRIAPNSTGAIVTFPDPAVSDNCSVAVHCLPTSGTLFPVGLTSVTCLSMDPAGNSASCGFLVAVSVSGSGLRSQKILVRDELVILLSSVTNLVDRTNLVDAIGHLTKAVDPRRWLDELHLVENQLGHGSFNEQKKAVESLLLLGDNASGIADALLQGLIDQLVAIDRELLTNAIERAIERQGKSTKIEKAISDRTRGDEATADNNPRQAIDRYRQGWKDATSA